MNPLKFFWTLMLIGLPIALLLGAQSNCGTTSDILLKDKKAEIGTNVTGRWQVTRVPGNENLSFAKSCFVDDSVGYAIANKESEVTFYRTSDGGMSWNKNGTISNFVATDLLIVGLRQALVIGNKYGPSSMTAENGSYVLESVDDGEHWQTTFESGISYLEKISAGENGFLVAVGWQNKQGNPKRKNLIIVSQDRGRSWVDVSDPLNARVKEENISADQGLTNVSFLNDGSTAVLSLRGTIYHTSDRGESWSILSKINYGDDQIGFYLFGQIGDRELWMAGGTPSKEGTWTLLARMTGSRVGEKIHVDGFVLSDMKFLGPQEIVACGSVRRIGKSSQDKGSNVGTILYSLDGGTHWETIFESKVATDFLSITKITESKLIASAESGETVFLERNP